MDTNNDELAFQAMMFSARSREKQIYLWYKMREKEEGIRKKI